MNTAVPGPDPDDASFVYDEMAYFGENCAEHGLPIGDVVVERVSHQLDDRRQISGLRWGVGEPRLVLLHGGAQNAHTWDTVALALRPTPLLAVDLPGHGRSSWRTGSGIGPSADAEDLARALSVLAPNAALTVGMSLGGLTAIALTRASPSAMRLVLVDITPGVNAEKAKAVHDFIAGPQSFPSFGEILERTVEFNPTRSPESLRRGILHNAHRTADGSWEWNYDRRPIADIPDSDDGELPIEGAALWEDISATEQPILLVRGSLSPVVGDDDVSELLRRRPDARVVVVDDAGHSVQGDRPLELAELIRAELSRADLDATESS